MTSDFDEINRTLGRLLASEESSQRQRATLFEKVAGIERAAASIEKSVAVLCEQARAHATADKLRFKAI